MNRVSLPGLGVALLLCAFVPAFAQDSVPENLYKGELVSYPGPWNFAIGRSAIILVSDEELDALADPDKVINLGLTHEPDLRSLRQVCEGAQTSGQRTLMLSFDHFFKQYRPGQDTPRRFTPDMDEYIQRIASISKFAQEYGLGLELSLLSPLEMGSAYKAQTGESGLWMHYREGLRDPESGTFSVQLWQQNRWANNKGVIDLEDAGVRVFAFREKKLGGTDYREVNPDEIIEITPVAQVEKMEGLLRKTGDYVAKRIRVYGTGKTDIGPLDRVLVVQQYRTPEMDYFSPKALPFLTGVVDKYHAAGVKLNGLYSDEMHIQGNWGYFSQHDHGEFALRYVSDGLARRYAELYGAQYADFAKYLVYFAYGQEDSENDLDAKQGIGHVMGGTPEDIRRTALFRARYYHLLQDGVVKLFTDAKRYAEQKAGYKLEARAHATWAESPTIDRWNVGAQNHQRYQYEYTSNFIWSDTVHQASAACYDYFAWGDFLTGNGNDHAEGGWIDRDYMALALACSTGILNEVPYSYCAHWGIPHELGRRRMSLVNVYGAAGTPPFGLVQDMQHRDVNVLMLYPIDLVAVEERFGSWMTQYGYANTVTQAKLLERGQVVDGAIEMAGRRFTTLCTTFEPFPSEKLLAMMSEFTKRGGRLIWSGPPPVLTAEGTDARTPWQDLVGVDYAPGLNEGLIAPGRQITFDGPLAAVTPQTVLADFLVEHIYPVTPREGTAAVARTKTDIVGTHRVVDGGGTVTFLGYRPRDDQSKSLGYETRNWFEILDTLGAYPATGRFESFNDNTEHLSRTTDYLTCRFPNGTVAIAKHFRDVEEGWPGGFARKAEQDAEYMAKNPPPSEALALVDFKVNGDTVTYDGEQAVAFRVDANNNVIAFAGNNADRIVVNGQTTVFADQKVGGVAWAPVEQSRRVEGGAIMQAICYGEATLHIPAVNLPETVEIFAEGRMPGSKGEAIPVTVENGFLVFTVPGHLSGRWLYVVPAGAMPQAVTKNPDSGTNVQSPGGA
ncbi:MAG: hypothetical protein RBU21_15195 [FCB group bacterium]|nr:hypothetical protein [FCB group bacterium]